jgi:hypothetical protein
MYKNSFLTENAPSLSLWKQVKKGDVRIALTRAEGAGIIGDEEADGFKIGGSSGQGIIGQMSIIGDEEADGFRNTSDFIYKNIIVNNILLEDVNGEKTSINEASITLKQYKKQNISKVVDKIYVFPNPANNRIDLLGEGIISYEIQNSKGQKLKQKLTSSNLTSIEIEDFPNGFYIIKIQTESGQQIRKLIVSH